MLPKSRVYYNIILDNRQQGKAADFMPTVFPFLGEIYNGLLLALDDVRLFARIYTSANFGAQSAYLLHKFFSLISQGLAVAMFAILLGAVKAKKL